MSNPRKVNNFSRIKSTNAVAANFEPIKSSGEGPPTVNNFTNCKPVKAKSLNQYPSETKTKVIQETSKTVNAKDGSPFIHKTIKQEQEDFAPVIKTKKNKDK